MKPADAFVRKWKKKEVKMALNGQTTVRHKFWQIYFDSHQSELSVLPLGFNPPTIEIWRQFSPSTNFLEVPTWPSDYTTVLWINSNKPMIII